MASVAEPEVLLAQKLASNDKPARRKALKKLRIYISARSRAHTGFSEDELLKLWKGLFYCLWMQDKPVLQEELSTQISGLIHRFHSFSAQLLFLRTFLTTVKREWTGIDRLRMDKYFQLVRFMFRQMFELLQRSQWDPSCVGLFLELVSCELLQAGAPSVGLQLHVLDLYLRELAVVGAPELTAEQNLIFIQPFMKTAAKTKDRALFRAICSSIFSTIIDQAPFAIQELLEELEQDSGASEDQEDQDEPEAKLKIGAEAKKAEARGQMNGTKDHSEEPENEEDDEDEDEGLSDTDRHIDEDMGPVLQFDYGAVADKLLELSSRGNTPSRNRQRLYKTVQVLRDLSQGSFPQDEYPEEVSTDEDDDGFGSRKRMKRKHMEEEPEEEPEQKTRGKKPFEPNEVSPSLESKKKKCKKMKSPNPTEPQSQTEDQPEPEKPPQENNTVMASQSKKKKKKRAKKSEGLNKEQQNGLTEQQTAPPETLQTKIQEQTNTEVLDTNTEVLDTNTEVLDTNTEVLDTNTEVLDTNTEVLDTNTEVLDTNTEVLDTNTEVLDTNTEVLDTNTEVLDTNTEVLDTNTEVLDTNTEVLDTNTEVLDTNTEVLDTTQTTQKKKKKKKVMKTSEAEVQRLEVTQTQVEEAVQPDHKNKKAKKKAVVTVDTGAEETPAPRTSVKSTKKRSAAGLKGVPQPDAEEDTGKKKKKKKKRKKIPVEFEYEAEEVQAEENEMNDTHNSDSKKVHFGLKNNRTAEFHRTDRSLLLSPEGPSRVPFDPDQKPKFGVLKSPPTPAPKPKKNGVRSRPTASDFF
ncbi:uncharacterized protein [Eucyclogobius newberryi]|uniref:uncharacterized protein isoform X2 n=1 Tax=Eucyclogobius newberryi TaxID=166745 RepID=UPI003B59480D